MTRYRLGCIVKIACFLESFPWQRAKDNDKDDCDEQAHRQNNNRTLRENGSHIRLLYPIEVECSCFTIGCVSSRCFDSYATCAKLRHVCDFICITWHWKQAPRLDPILSNLKSSNTHQQILVKRPDASSHVNKNARHVYECNLTHILVCHGCTLRKINENSTENPTSNVANPAAIRPSCWFNVRFMSALYRKK